MENYWKEKIDIYDEMLMQVWLLNSVVDGQIYISEKG